MAEAKRPRADRSEAVGARAKPQHGGASQLPDTGSTSADYWLDELRSDAAAQTRRRENWLRRQSAEDATVAGVLVDHAEQRSVLAITTRSGHRHIGQVLGAGSALVLLEVGGALVAIEVGEIATFRATPESDRRPLSPTGHRGQTSNLTMGELLSQVVDDRPEVSLVARSGEQVAGTLMAVGRDVVIVRPPLERGLVYLPLASVSEALLPASTGSG